uniref:Hydrolase n=1 Tax=Thermosporothrix sp. COM3 TaxID=2490863 RepID=A0A455SSI3_9CHLR|nr:hydrolase [Thermosporothrix sp. COM3]
MPNQVHSLLTPGNCTAILVDYQPQMAFAVHSIDDQTLLNNTVGLARALRVFQVPTVLTTVAAESFSGKLFPQLLEIFPNQTPIDRTTMNCWEDSNVLNEVKKIGRKKLILGGLWTEVCIVFPAIQAIEAGYEVYVVADACGATSDTAHEMAMQRMIQAGAVPVTWLQVMLEFQRDWAREQTYDAVMGIAKQHAGAYGIGITYAKAILGEHASEAASVSAKTRGRSH